MNIFKLSHSRRACVVYMCDKHVVKMILEYAQLLSTAHRVLGTVPADSLLYKATHINHPCAVWVRSTRANYVWLYGLFILLCNEYTYRYGRTHLCEQKLATLLATPPSNICMSMEKTPIPQAMPDKYRGENDVDAYRAYYIGEKASFARWTKRDVPEWFTV